MVKFKADRGSQRVYAAKHMMWGRCRDCPKWSINGRYCRRCVWKQSARQRALMRRRRGTKQIRYDGVPRCWLLAEEIRAYRERRRKRLLRAKKAAEKRAAIQLGSTGAP